MLYWTSVVAVALVSSVIHYVSWIMSFSNLSLLPSAVRYRIWCRRSAGNRRHRVRLNSDPAGVNSACFYPEGGCELWGQALFGSLLWRRTVLLGRGWRWETGSWKQKVSPILLVTTVVFSHLVNLMQWFCILSLFNCFPSSQWRQMLTEKYIIGHGIIVVKNQKSLLTQICVLDYHWFVIAAYIKQYSMCGLFPSPCDRPRVIESLRGVEVVDIAAGGAHSACITASGELYTWGKGRYGRLGHGDSEDQLKPKLVRSLCIFIHI